ncbi:hypothetical protein AB2L28_02880 [Kineococcus sp. TBRC 1896]|uniref:Uncharacterized protein n=1 Tax=Kineococcus mangrovi TaxID=1660183 RepID=A0ABV4HXM2_9ACTN
MLSFGWPWRGSGFGPDDLPQPRHRFTSTGDARAFRLLAQRFLGPQLGPQLVDVDETGPLYLGAL